MRLQTTAWAVAATLVVGVLAAIGAWWWKHERGIEVRLQNAEQAPLYFVVVRVLGDTRFVSAIPPGATFSVNVRPIGDSGIGVSYITRDGQARDELVEGYVEAGDSGWVSGRLTSRGVDRTEDHIDHGGY